MSAELIGLAVRRSIFQPRHQFAELANDHVAFDSLTGSSRFEAKTLRSVLERNGAVAVVGPRGGGKSSLIACVCGQLPETHMALRIPVSGADDPTSVSVMGAVALGQALNDLDMEDQHRSELERARADGRVLGETPRRIGGTLGGGPIPAAIHTELGSLRDQLETRSQAIDRLAGLERLIAILTARGRKPLFVLEDTEATIGGADPDDAERFFTGPVHAFVNELDASFLIAVQDVIASTRGFREMAGTFALVELPGLGEDEVVPALTRIIENRLGQHEEPERSADRLLSAEALQALASLYEESSANLRETLAVLQSACEYAYESGADIVGPGRVRAAAADWRERNRG
jgi:energy-coupling factor transporter ATP-binding protein EcfA2